jgi:hypothetical protein
VPPIRSTPPESDPRRARLDGYVEGLCERFDADEGRGLPPGRCFRLPLIGYFEGLDDLERDDDEDHAAESRPWREASVSRKQKQKSVCARSSRRRSTPTACCRSARLELAGLGRLRSQAFWGSDTAE